MSQHSTHAREILSEDSAPDLLAPLTIIRTETVLSRFPLHTLTKTGSIPIHITRKNAHGDIELSWHVSPNPAYGEPRQLAYKLDTLVIHHAIHTYGHPLPKILRLGSMAQICRDLDLVVGGNGHTRLRQAFLQNAFVAIVAKVCYTATDGTARTLEAGFTRYSVVFTGERLPDGTLADAVYLILNEPYWDILNTAPMRPLDYNYLKALVPTAQRWYEILSYKFFTAIKYRHAHAKLLYSEYCTFAAQQRYLDYDHVKKQMYKIHKPHSVSKYLASVRYEATTDEVGAPDWMMYYIPGAKAHAEYLAFNTRGRRPRRAATPALALVHAKVPGVVSTTVDAPPNATPPVGDEMLIAEAHALVQYFHQRFHGTSDAVPSAKAVAQALELITRHGVERARHVVDFSLTAAHATNYQPQTFSGIVQYTAQALIDHEKAQQRAAAEAQAAVERRRAQTEETQRRQYDAYRTACVAQLRATLPPAELAALEDAAAARFEREHRSPFGREQMRRLALDEAVAVYGQVLTFEAWHATQGQE